VLRAAPAKKFERECRLSFAGMPTHTQKNGALRALLPLKRANILAFCLHDRAAGQCRLVHPLV
jgi:hypothetical protein